MKTLFRDAVDALVVAYWFGDTIFLGVFSAILSFALGAAIVSVVVLFLDATVSAAIKLLFIVFLALSFQIASYYRLLKNLLLASEKGLLSQGEERRKTIYALAYIDVIVLQNGESSALGYPLPLQGLTPLIVMANVSELLNLPQHLHVITIESADWLAAISGQKETLLVTVKSPQSQEPAVSTHAIEERH